MRYNENGGSPFEKWYTLLWFKDLPKILDYLPLLAFKNGITIRTYLKTDNNLSVSKWALCCDADLISACVAASSTIFTDHSLTEEAKALPTVEDGYHAKAPNAGVVDVHYRFKNI